jgi:hypothetical protein
MRSMSLVLLLALLGSTSVAAAPRALEAQRRAQRAARRAPPAAAVAPSETVMGEAPASSPAVATTLPVDDAPTPPVVPPSPAAEAPPPAVRGAREGENAGMRLRAQLGLVRRSLSFTQDLYQRMRRQELTLPVYRLDGAVFPLLGVTPFGARVGLIAGYERAFGSSVRDSDFRESYEVDYWEWYGGARVAHPLQGDLLGFELAAGRLASGLAGDDGAGTPDLRYTYVRTGLDFTLRRGPIEAMLAGAFRVPLGYGQLADVDWFPRVGGYGVEGELTVRYALSARLSGEVSASARRFLLEMNPAPEDAAAGISEVVGGATDDYLAGYIGLRFAL